MLNDTRFHKVLGTSKTSLPALALLPGIIPKIRASRDKMPDVFTYRKV